MTPSATSVVAARRWPNATAMTAAIAPSVAQIGAMIETLPRRSAAYDMPRPPTEPMLDTASHATSPVPASPVTPRTAATGATTTKPISMTHASTEGEPMRRVERDEQNVDVPQQSAAAMPPRIAATRAFSRSGARSGRTRCEAGDGGEAAACGDDDRDVR